MINESGFHPRGPRVLIKVDKVEEVSEGGIILAQDLVNKEQNAQIKGVVVEIGPDCWMDTPLARIEMAMGKDPTAWCKVGDRVQIGKYAGNRLIGKDEQEYRVVNDLDIVGIEE